MSASDNPLIVQGDHTVLVDTVEQDFALKRQLFLCEQGYQYHIRDIDSEVSASEMRALSTQVQEDR